MGFSIKSEDGFEFKFAGDLYISAGPSKKDLEDSLFLGDFSSRKEVTFTMRAGDKAVIHSGVAFGTSDITRIVLRVGGVDREDGSGESWVVRGYVTSVDGHKVRGGASIEFYYSSKTRQGVIVFDN